MAEEKQRLSPQEIQERKISLVKERGSRVLLINSPLGATLCNILRQFDLAYANFKGRLGEMGGISYEEGEALMAEGREVSWPSPTSPTNSAGASTSATTLPGRSRSICG